MFRTALRNVLAHKLRLLMTMLAVVLGTAFVAGTLIFTATIDKGLQDSSAKSFAGISVAVQSDGFEGTAAAADEKPSGVSERTYRELAALPGVASAQGTVTGFTGVADADGDLIGNGWSNVGGNYAPTGDSGDPRYTFTDGRGPQGSGEVALDTETAQKGGYTVGDTVRLSVNGPVLEKKLSGVFDTDDGTVAAGGTLALYDTATAQELFLAPGLYQDVNLRADSGVSEKALLAEAEETVAGQKDVEAVTGQQLIDDQAKAIASQTSSMNTVFLSFAGIALFVGIFLIANTFTMLVAQRTRELALLRAVGASRRQVTRSVLIEATVVGLVSSVVGFGAGVGIAAGLRALLGENAGLPQNPMVITGASVLAALAVGVVITVLAAWLPARRAAKIPPVAAMASVDTPAKHRSLVIRNAIGAVFAAAGAVVLGLGLGVDDGSTAAMVVGGGAVLLLVGVIVLTPLLSGPVVALFRAPLRAFGISGKLAAQNAVRNPRRTAATATALMIGLTLISALTVITGSMKSGLEKAATQELRADYAIQMANFSPLDGSVVEKVEKVPGVAAATGDTTLELKADGTELSTTITDTSVFDRMFSPEKVKGDVQGMGAGTVAVMEGELAERGWEFGEEVAVDFPDGKQETLRIAAVYGDSDMMSKLTVDERTAAPHLYTDADQTVFVKAEPGKAGPELQEAVKDALGDSPIIEVRTQDELLQEFNKQIDMVLNMVYGLLGMSVVVAVIGVVNTMAMSVFERSREIGMLRAIGMDRRTVKRMIRLESLLISVFGALLGLGMGTFLGWAAGRLIVKSFDTYSMVVPWGTYAVFLALALLVGVLAALWPARRAARLNALEAIKAE